MVSACVHGSLSDVVLLREGDGRDSGPAAQRMSARVPNFCFPLAFLCPFFSSLFNSSLSIPLRQTIRPYVVFLKRDPRIFLPKMLE